MPGIQVTGRTSRQPIVHVDEGGGVWDYLLDPGAEGNNAITGNLPGRWSMRQPTTARTAARGGSGGTGDGGGDYSMGALEQLSERLAGIMPTPPARVAAPGVADSSAAMAAAYGAAKDRVGRNSEAAIRSLRNVMQQRGISGSGIEAEGTANILGSATSELGGISRDIAGKELQRKYQTEDQQYQGDLQQRGQDISLQQGRVGLLPSLLSFMKTTNTGRLY
jgi:hypothetical protein